MAAALSRVLTLPVVEIIASFMDFAPGVPETDKLITLLMLQIRKNCVDNRKYSSRESSMSNDVMETCVKVGERYRFKFEVRKAVDPNEDDDEDEDEDEDHLVYSLVDKEIHGWLVKNL